MAEMFDLKQSRWGNYESGYSTPDYLTLIKIAKKFGKKIDDLLTNNLELDERRSTISKSQNDPIKEVQPVLVTVNEDGRENITLVPVRAQAGYLTHYNDQSYIQELPAFHIPIPRYQTGTFRAFEVEGFSMQSFTGAGLSPGDIVIARYVDDPLSMRDSRVYVIISTEGVLIKRIINRLGNDQKLILKSDNKSNDYPDILLEPEQIMEVWEFKAKISAQIPPENAYELINRLQGDVAILTSEVKELKNRIS